MGEKGKKKGIPQFISSKFRIFANAKAKNSRKWKKFANAEAHSEVIVKSPNFQRTLNQKNVPAWDCVLMDSHISAWAIRVFNWRLAMPLLESVWHHAF